MKKLIVRPKLLSQSAHFDVTVALSVLAVIVLVGTVIIFRGRAAGPFASLDLGAASTVASPATSINDGTASGGSYVQFGSTTPTPPPSGARRGWQVTEANTGLSGVGINRDTLPLIDASQYQSDGPYIIIPANTTVSNVKISRPVKTGGPGIVFDRVFFQEQLQGGYGTIVKNSDFDTGTTDCASVGYYTAIGTGQINGVYADGDFRLYRVKLQRWGVGAWLGGGSNARPSIEESYFANLVGCGDPAGSGTHNETARIGDSYTGPGATVKNNFFDARAWPGSTPNSTGALFIMGDGGSTRNVTSSGNVFLGGANYAVQADTHNGGFVGDLIFDDNRFETGKGCSCPNSILTNNYYYDPTKPDAKGAPL